MSDIAATPRLFADQTENGSFEEPEASRIMAMASNPRPILPTAQDSMAAVQLALAAGARGFALTYTWKELEPSKGTYFLQKLQTDLTDLTGAGFSTIFVGIQVINTVAKETPADLISVDWNDSLMERRFRALIDAIRPLMVTAVRYISIGNEVDVYLSQHPSEWSAYQTFYEEELDYLHQSIPSLQVGVTTTFMGATGIATSPSVIQLNNRSDVSIFTYYPLESDYRTRGPESPFVDLPTMVSLSGGRPVVLQEIGYPSSPVLASSESDQAMFITNAFQAWDAMRDRIPFLAYFFLHDLTPDICESGAAYYGLSSNVNFMEYFCSLGLLHTDGRAKPSWQSLVGAAAQSGFEVAAAWNVSSASYALDALARESIATAFGTSLATANVEAVSPSMTTSLAGTEVAVRDSVGATRLAPLFFVAPNQVNYQIPKETAVGPATITISSGYGMVSTSYTTITSVAPGLFAANGNGIGVAAALAVRISPDEAQTEVFKIFQCGSNPGSCISVPIDLGEPGYLTVLTLFGTGIREASSLDQVRCFIGGTIAPITYAGSQQVLTGLDQVNVVLPRQLAGEGDLELVITVDGRPTNPVHITVK